jgi:hypothetical protein
MHSSLELAVVVFVHKVVDWVFPARVNTVQNCGRHLSPSILVGHRRFWPGSKRKIPIGSPLKLENDYMFFLLFN